MRRNDINKLVGFTVGSRRFFERARIHNESIFENFESCLFYNRQVKQSEFEYDEEEIFNCFLNNNLIVKLKNKQDKHGKPIYSLTESKIKACESVAIKLKINPGTLRAEHFPSNIRKPVTCTQNCKDCQKRSKLISSLKRTFNRKSFCVETPINNYVPDNKIKNISIVNPLTGIRHQLTVGQQKEYKSRQNALKILDQHFYDKIKATELWRQMFIENKIRRDTVVIIIDGMAGLTVGSGEGIRGLKGPRCSIIPIGIIFLYSDPITGKTKRLSRVCIPDATTHNTWQYTQSIKKLFQKNDTEVLNLFQTRDKVIVNYSFENI